LKSSPTTTCLTIGPSGDTKIAVGDDPDRGSRATGDGVNLLLRQAAVGMDEDDERYATD
jgi:hypothetical protein